MYIHLINKKIEGYNYLELNDYIVNYKVEGKELFRETNDFYLFIDTNYSERYIEECLSNKLTVEKLSSYFKKDGLLVLIHKTTSEVFVYRDLAGLCTGYYYSAKNEFVLSSNVHSLGKKFANGLNKPHVYQLLYFDFLRDGQTIYNNIKQIKVGGEIIINDKLSIIKNIFNQPNIADNENHYSETENIKRLRQEIVKAHKPYVNDLNTIFLSGGIDSVAMLIALDDLTEKQKIENHSFKVKGTTQDETIYAKSIANHLDVDLKIIERDFQKEITEDVFVKKITMMNNPYSGMWIFGNQINNNVNKTYFAGQDTRLHTPALNKLDQLAFEVFTLSKKGLAPLFCVLHVLMLPIRKAFDFILSKRNIHNKFFLGLRRASYIFNTRSYLNIVYFKLDKAYLKALKLPLNYFNSLVNTHYLDITSAKNKRMLYNILVSEKWVEQYVNDMRYMIDMVKYQGGKLAMPFYDMDLAKFSATIPFSLSIKNIKGESQFSDKPTTIHKYVLRESLKDKIDKKTYLRSKAVSRTGHIIFKQSLHDVIKKILLEDMSNKSNSFIKEYELSSFVNRFLKTDKEDWIMTDDKYLLKVYYLSCLIIYNNEIVTKN